MIQPRMKRAFYEPFWAELVDFFRNWSEVNWRNGASTNLKLLWAIMMTDENENAGSLVKQT